MGSPLFWADVHVAAHRSAIAKQRRAERSRTAGLMVPGWTTKIMVFVTSVRESQPAWLLDDIPAHLRADPRPPSKGGNGSLRRTLEDAERREIVAALENAIGKVGRGPNGAAALLGMSRSTLLFRMQKLSISASHVSYMRDLLPSNG